jgi:heat-inducible transcriptional repressor
MLSPRQQRILDAIVAQYINRARPVPSQAIIDDRTLGVSSATVRNEMARLEEEGFIIRPHTSAGSVPTDKGYRHYVQSIRDPQLPLAERRQLDQSFRTVAGELDDWLNLAASLLAETVRSTAVVSSPRAASCRFKHLELVGLQDGLVLVVLVFNGARVKQALVTFEPALSQAKLSAMAAKLSGLYTGQNSTEITEHAKDLTVVEEKVTEYVVKVMKEEDGVDDPEPFLNGLHFLFSQPEFVNDRRLAQSLMELIEGGQLLRSILPPEFTGEKVEVIIGRENRSELQDYGIVVARYGQPRQAAGTIGVIGPTRMNYDRAIATVGYLASVLGHLMTGLYEGMADDYREVN